ncbi:hypothetical protein [Paenibacillus dendritiformis]|uniref:hypothetical protein n=1 Tax=Paenibacillus dendritiformis TaxID=130049 RepID=UPI00387E02D2
MSTINSWSEVIDKIAERNKEVDEKLSPSQCEMRYVVDYGRIIYDKLQLINNASKMAHEGIIDFDTGQKIIDLQKKTLKRDIEYLLLILD